MSEVFFDRETQLETLDEIGRRVASGRGALAIVEGIAGIGKSALVREFLLEEPGQVRGCPVSDCVDAMSRPGRFG